MSNYEAMLVAGLLRSPEYIDVIPLDEKSFGDSNYKAVYGILKQLKDGVVNPGLVVQELENREWKNSDAVKLVSTLVGLCVDEPEMDALEFYAAKIDEGYQRRHVCRQLADLIKKFKDFSVPYTDNLGDLGQIAISAQMGLVQQDDVTGAGIVGRLIDRIAKGIPPSYPSGYPLLDANLAAMGIKPEQIWCIVAPYKSYKTRGAMQIVDNALSIGKSVTYIALEDNEEEFSTALMAAHFGIPLRSFEYRFANKPTAKAEDVDNAVHWLSEQRWQVYDRKRGIGKWQRVPAIVMADKMKHDTDLVVVDHLQKWAKRYEDLGEIDNMLTDLAAQSGCAFLLLSQVSNETLREKSPKNMFPTKGTGDMGGLVHVGIEMFKDAEKSDFIAKQPLLDKLAANGTLKYLNAERLVSEVGLWLKVVRRGNPVKTYCIFDPYSGKALLQQAAAERLEW